MEINAKCRYDYESVKALTHVSVYKRKNPQKTFIITNIYLAVLALVSIIVMFIDADMTSYSMLACVTLIIILNDFLHLGLPKIQFEALCKMKNIENEYTFYDDLIKVSSKSEEYNGEAELKYSMIPKVMETSKYLFIFKNKNQVFAVDKSTIINGTINEIREKLVLFLETKYIICKY